MLLPLKTIRNKGVNERGSFPSLCISISTAIVIDLMTETLGIDPSEFQDPADLYQFSMSIPWKRALDTIVSHKTRTSFRTPLHAPMNPAIHKHRNAGTLSFSCAMAKDMHPTGAHTDRRQFMYEAKNFMKSNFSSLWS